MNRREFLRRSSLVVAAPAIVRYDSLMKPVPVRDASKLFGDALIRAGSMDITIDQMRDMRRKLQENEIPPGPDGYYYFQVGGVENLTMQEWSNRLRAEMIDNLILGKV